MACTHPEEERLSVYEGTAHPRPDRRICALCGALIYEALAPASANPFAVASPRP